MACRRACRALGKPRSRRKHLTAAQDCLAPRGRSAPRGARAPRLAAGRRLQPGWTEIDHGDREHCLLVGVGQVEAQGPGLAPGGLPFLGAPLSPSF